MNDPVLLNDWLAVAWSSSVPPGSLLPIRILDRDLVLWRGQSGLHAWRDLCIHRGSKLSLGKVSLRNNADCVACPYHGWEYNVNGECVHIPAHPDQPPPLRARVEDFSVREKHGLVWICLGTARGAQVEVPSFPEGEAPGFRSIYAGPYEFQAQGPRIIENLLDVAHLPVTHAGLLGDAAHAEIGDYSVITGSPGIVAEDIPIWQPDPDGTGRPTTVRYSYWVERPLTARMVKVHGRDRFALLGSVTPVNKHTSLAWIVIALNYAQDVPDDELRSFQDKVTAQDIRIVNSQRPEFLPLDLQTDLHLRSDQLAIAYRRWLTKSGMRYGTS
ncbi:MAG TPA: aromatic ring-hydroxylating dioxygenase subunit alpha [Candidatus Aquilonibacter sp.]|nr:aromatic ring-hydroxylating dioxygenase subunit alpha [Candidatus Aquilonibacter sp.]